MTKKQKTELLAKGRTSIIAGVAIFVFFWWTIIGAIVGVILIIDGANARMKAREL